jgi:hypothetical protein
MRYERVVSCSEPGCEEAAIYKIAAPWSDGRFKELKTYGFACAEHLQEVLRSAETRWLDYEPVKGESVHDVGVYHYERGKSDRELHRVEDVEDRLQP